MPEPSDAELRSLQHGDIVRHMNGKVYVIIETHADRSPIAIRTITVSNPQEWRIIKRHDWSVPHD
jgi:hypothetical protein